MSPVRPSYRSMSFDVHWSDEDGEYVGLCDRFPSLSFLHADAGEALKGIVLLVADCIKDGAL